jgi:hypothetical protein
MCILVINLELVGERFFSHIENLDTFQSYLDCKGYSCHKRLLSILLDIIYMMGGWSDGAAFQW